ncbi:zinc finger domain containing protein [Entamoeba histolytica HM-1:IMSS-B]|uniref:GATA-type domain-containing protein n=9 Tax=Entamoeba TaxID=5758 RepID=C4M1P5_ENTH1|nr:uncharacterized protein EDI_044240 [Entamoeba dispar SAW760]XP_008856338.1 GATA zinc finger domain containing protein [Entamoeba nuttalli P19]XP_650545.1 hypothetical protein EHI_062690 [Entamoeba histolytica HM-1:IMSS]EMD47217.1 GATA zinc finger domain containing protein [Entamoeba histolytica KU27]EMH76226.1 zinc finger domain containing protein [Entamoeba histolytica HM-1:IMSS-B]ENY60241.1 GATA zinc finger domain containing protein [Entamoeba histolytica HM-1:IMSS-A]EAL45159.1 hypotheti|eukprot:EDR25868.1 hypothetical protein EDI_044240 [Entamoeba dispar SAW760]
METEKVMADENITDLPSCVKFSCDFRQSVLELLLWCNEKNLPIEQFALLKSRMLGMLEEYNRQLYQGTSLEQTQPVIEQQKKPQTEPTNPNGKKQRGRPKLDHNRECSICHTTKTSEWRTGESPNTFLCNACGLKALKKKKREQQMATTPTSNFVSGTNYIPS